MQGVSPFCFAKIALKSLLHRPGYFVLTSVLLSIGMGMTVSVFSFSRAVLKPAFANPERLMAIHAFQEATEVPMSPNQFKILQSSAQSLTYVGAYAQFADADFLLNGSSLYSINSAAVTMDFLPMFGGNPLLGRVFEQQDMRGGTVILSWALWQRVFLGDASKVGSVVRINGFPFRIIGIMGPQFRFPPGIDIWLPQDLNNPYTRNDQRLHTIGVLKPDADLARLQAELNAQRQVIEPTANMRFSPEPLLAGLSDQVKILYAAAIFAISMLLLVAADAASLALMRVQKDVTLMAIHSALGAGRFGLLLHLFFQAVYISLAGVLLGGVLYVSSFRILTSWAASYITGSPGVFQLGAGLMLLALAVFFIVLLTCIPAAVALKPELMSLLPRGPVSSGPRFRAAFATLLVLEIASSAALLYAAGISSQSLRTMQSLPLGFNPEGVQEVIVYIPNPERRTRVELAHMTVAAINDLSSRSGIERAGASLRPAVSPFLGQMEASSSDSVSRRIDIRAVTPGYFGALGVPLVRGRDFDTTDDLSSNVILDQDTTRALWNEEEAVGRQVLFGAQVRETLVGVVGSIKAYEKAQPVAYIPLQGSLIERPPFITLHVFVRTRLSLQALKPIIDGWMHTLPQASAASDINPLNSELAPYLEVPRKQRVISLVLSAVAIFVTTVGLYTVMTFWTAIARRSLAIRVSLGASPGSIYAHLAKPLIIATAAGCVAGLAIAKRVGYVFVVGAPAMAPVSWLDVSIFSLLAALVILSSVFPALRVTKNPIEILKSE
jgi:putative ABC transport system permease protein